MSTAHCPACGKDVPAGDFCASCGARQQGGHRAGRLRLSAYAAAPRQHVLRPWVTSSLFPQLPKRSRTAFRVGLILLAVAVVGFAMLRWQVPIIAVSVFGLPLLLAVYLHEVDARHSLPVRHLVLVTVMGLGLGVGWSIIAGPTVADAYNAALGGQMGIGQLLLCGVAIPITFGLALLAPVALVRVLDRSRGESLDGFTFGAVGATVVNAASTATLLWPQLTMGITAAASQSVENLLSEALIEGVAWPVGSLATGGIFGIALWFTPTSEAGRRHRRAVVVLAALLGALAFTVAMGVVDVAPMSAHLYIGLELLIAMLAVLGLRAVITDALLHEAPDEPSSGPVTENVDAEHANTEKLCAEILCAEILCAECDHVVAYKSFCTDCGVAIRAGSRASRTVRSAPNVVSRPGAGKARYRGVLGPMSIGLATAAAVCMAAAVLMKPAPAAYVCPPDCGKPPLGKPVETNPRFSGDNGAFSVAYPGEGSAYDVTFDPPGINGVVLKYVGGDTGTLTLFGEPARDRTAEQIVHQVLDTNYPGAVVDYEIPNASVGYEPGYGVVADLYPRDTSSTFTRLRVIIMAAVRHDYALIAAAAGPYHEFSPTYGTGHPSGANLEVAMDMGKYVNSFRWYGDRYTHP